MGFSGGGWRGAGLKGRAHLQAVTGVSVSEEVGAGEGDVVCEVGRVVVDAVIL